MLKFVAVRPRRHSRPRAAGATTTRGEAAVRVQVSSRAPSHRSQFVDQLQGDDSGGGAPRDIDFTFSENLADLHDTDVVLLTAVTPVIGDRRDPEQLQVRNASRFVRSLRRHNVALVRALYAEAAHSVQNPTRAEEILNRATTSFIAMDPFMAVPDPRAVTVIEHSHFRERFLGHPLAQVVPGRLVFLSMGGVDPSYEAPLKVFGIADLPGCTLHVVGKVPRALTASFERTLTRHSTRVSLIDGDLSDSARLMELTQAEIVVVAAPDTYESMRVILLALSLDRPVLVEETPLTRAIADEVGGGWVRLHDGRLTAEGLELALQQIRSAPPVGRPKLDARNPNTIAAQYVSVLKAAAASR